MSRIIPLLLSLLLSASMSRAADGPASSEPHTSYRETMMKAQTAYRTEFAASLGEATKVEILLLDFKIQRYEGWTEGAWEYDLPKEQFPITPYKSVTRILKSKVLTAAEMKKLMPALQATVGVKNAIGGAMCHYPIHGIRVWAGDRMIFHTSFCWMCGNFYLEYPDFTVHWIGIQGTKLKEVFAELMPIPPSEMERFKKSEKLPDGLRLN